MDRQAYRTIIAGWASGVTIVALRDEGAVIATTVTAFLSLSLDPPTVLVSIGPNATVRPFLTTGRSFGISILAAGHKRLASIFADSYAVGPSPFGGEDPPLIDDALVRLTCTVDSVLDGGTHVLVIAAVQVAEARDGAPLIRHAGHYGSLPHPP